MWVTHTRRIARHHLPRNRVEFYKKKRERERKSQIEKKNSHPLDSPSPNSSRSVAQWLFGAGRHGNEQVFHDAPHTRRCYWCCCMDPRLARKISNSQTVKQREKTPVKRTSHHWHHRHRQRKDLSRPFLFPSPESLESCSSYFGESVDWLATATYLRLPLDHNKNIQSSVSITLDSSYCDETRSARNVNVRHARSFRVSYKEKRRRDFRDPPVSPISVSCTLYSFIPFANIPKKKFSNSKKTRDCVKTAAV